MISACAVGSQSRMVRLFPPRENLAFLHKDCADRDFVRFRGGAGFFERKLHVFCIVHG